MRPDPNRSWVIRAACRDLDVEMFFPGLDDMAGVRAAKAVCAGCGVAEECMGYALRLNLKYGIFGGFGEFERKMRRSARQAVRLGRRTVATRPPGRRDSTGPHKRA